ncbi:MAG: ABC transporter ATP-binding protein [Candidatus Eisenbacteria bacterium]|uniref:ABC transporter ATP-binding protein n=1 Tax=Eiseniibacteriota bacterium TaxID=2212470 RepID=A0A849SHN6_UNCEI|nr:ABC transporter ATP-binding protein [Candidatus Eisenbacteria bacterium]
MPATTLHAPADAHASSDAPAVETRDLRRIFKTSRGGAEVRALDGVSIRIERGEVFGLLGPNGAGKTTLIKILSTLLFPTTGEARVAGHDVVAQSHEVRRRIALVSGGESSGYGILTVRECLWMFGQFYGVPSAESWRRADELIKIVQLEDQSSSRINRLSTGQRQRMNFARGFMSDPEILFLDEPTLGMDVNAARILREYVATWVRERPGRTVLLTTHYMAEAEQLCDRIAIVDRGKVLACDSTPALRRQVQGGQHVELELRAAGAIASDVMPIPDLNAVWGAPHPDRGTRSLKFRLPPERSLGEVLRVLEAQGLGVEGVATRETSLEDVFIAIVGRGLEDTGEST